MTRPDRNFWNIAKVAAIALGILFLANWIWPEWFGGSWFG